MKTRIDIGFKSKTQAPWLMVVREYWENGEVVNADVLFEFWPRYFKKRWLKIAKGDGEGCESHLEPYTREIE